MAVKAIGHETALKVGLAVPGLGLAHSLVLGHGLIPGIDLVATQSLHAGHPGQGLQNARIPPSVPLRPRSTHVHLLQSNRLLSQAHLRDRLGCRTQPVCSVHYCQVSFTKASCSSRSSTSTSTSTSPNTNTNSPSHSHSSSSRFCSGSCRSCCCRISPSKSTTYQPIDLVVTLIIAFPNLISSLHQCNGIVSNQATLFTHWIDHAWTVELFTNGTFYSAGMFSYICTLRFAGKA